MVIILLPNGRGPSLISPNEARNNRNHGLYALAVILLVFAGVALYKDSQNQALRAFGGLALLASMYLLSKSRRQRPTVSTETTVSTEKTYQRPDVRPAPPTRSMWSLGAASLVLIGISYWLLVNDAAHGHNQVWPVYLFAGAILIGGSFLAYLVTRIMR
jgi:drug/metabolite transporter (DMT)-like permease